MGLHASKLDAVPRLAALATWFIMDSGCTFHCHPFASDLINTKPLRQHMVAADGSKHRVTCIGDLPLTCRGRDNKLRRIVLRVLNP